MSNCRGRIRLSPPPPLPRRLADPPRRIPLPPQLLLHQLHRPIFQRTLPRNQPIHQIAFERPRHLLQPFQADLPFLFRALRLKHHPRRKPHRLRNPLRRKPHSHSHRPQPTLLRPRLPQRPPVRPHLPLQIQSCSLPHHPQHGPPSFLVPCSL